MKDNIVKGINIERFSTVLILIEAILFFLSILTSIFVYENHKKVDRITDDYIGIQSDIYSLQMASDLMSAKSRQYVMTGEVSFAYEYFKEVDETKRRDFAVSNIKERISDVGHGAAEPIEMAFNKSNALMEKEIHAMALIASLADNQDYYPSELTEYVLPEEELNFSESQKKDFAYSLVFGGGYSYEKLSIRESVDKATDNLLGEIGQYKDMMSDRYKMSFSTLMFILALSLINFIVIAVCLFRLVLHPLDLSIRAIQEEKTIPLCKSYELNYLATTYNLVYEQNATTRLHLKNKAERDELTGLLNRSAFNDLVDFYKNANEELAFLIMDVDYFKTVNDQYGHAIGDKALKKVATLLSECFRSNDFPIRYGGDEFAVIMTELSHEQKGVIERKLNYINETLQKEDSSGIPKLSVSVGVAFSKAGFADDLFKRADDALYKTKENGRHGYTFA